VAEIIKPLISPTLPSLTLRKEVGMSEVTIGDLLSGKVRLVFGDDGQLNAIKLHEQITEAALKRCKTCDGDGVVTCKDCNGTGEKP